MLLAPFGLIVVAAIYKSLQIRAASDWPSAPGKVITSNSQVRKVDVLDDTHADGRSTEERNFANIVYEYSVSGQKLTNNRVSIGEDRGNFQVAETIAKYPVGTAVTVYYNSRHPKDAVLERELPHGMWGCLGIGAIVMLIAVFGGTIGLSRINAFIGAHLADPKLSVLVVAMGAFGSAIAVFGLALYRQASAAKTWPLATGKIKVSEPESYRAAASDSGRTGQVMYRTQVFYSFRFNNIAYTNLHSSFSTSAPSNSGWLARKFQPKYKTGDVVKVYVDPQNPAQSTLDPDSKAAWFLWFVASGFWYVAYYVATHG